MPKAEYGLWGLGLTVFLVASPDRHAGRQPRADALRQPVRGPGQAGRLLPPRAKPMRPGRPGRHGGRRGRQPLDHQGRHRLRHRDAGRCSATATSSTCAWRRWPTCWWGGCTTTCSASCSACGPTAWPRRRSWASPSCSRSVGVVGLALWPTALVLLAAHFLSQAVVLLGCVILLQGAMRQAEGYQAGRKAWLWTEAEAGAGEAHVPVDRHAPTGHRRRPGPRLPPGAAVRLRGHGRQHPLASPPSKSAWS